MKNTQYELVLNHLKNHKNGITSMDAFQKYGITRLSGTIYNLKKDGYKISSTTETKKNRYGNSCSFARYKLEA